MRRACEATVESDSAGDSTSIPQSVETITRVLVESSRGIRDRIAANDVEISEEFVATVVNFSRSAALVAGFMETHQYPAHAGTIRAALLELGDALDRAILDRAYDLNRNLSESIKGVLGETATPEQRATLDRSMELLITNVEQAASRAREAGYDEYVEKFLFLIGQGRHE